LALVLFGLNRLGLGLPSHWFIVVAALAAATMAVLIFPAHASGTGDADDASNTESAEECVHSFDEDGGGGNGVG